MHAYDTGYYAASHGEEPVPYDESFYEEDRITDENVNAYNAACEERYLKNKFSELYKNCKEDGRNWSKEIEAIEPMSLRAL